MTTDVCVIGGGVNGLAIAYLLLKEGKKVVLLERSDIGSGASGACDDMILLQSKQPGINLELAFESLELYKGLDRELGVDLDFKSMGGMILIENELQLSIMEDFVKQQIAGGLQVEIIGQAELRRRQPHVAHDIIASTYSAVDSQVDPLMLMRGYVKQILKMGGEILRPANVKRVEKQNGHWRVESVQGHVIDCDMVVNAAGAWAGQVGQLSGIEIPIGPRRGQLLLTEQVAPIGETNVWSAAYIASKLDPTILPYANEFEKSIGLGFSFTRTRDGNYIIGSTRESALFDKQTSSLAVETILRQATRYFPILKTVNIIRTIAGLRPASIDGKPVVGEVPDHEGYFIAAGHEGDGIALAPITASKVVDMMMRRNYDLRMEQLSIKRFMEWKEQV